LGDKVKPMAELSEFVVEVMAPAQGSALPVRVVPDPTSPVRLATTPTAIDVSLVPAALRIPNTRLRVVLGKPWRFTKVLGRA